MANDSGPVITPELLQVINEVLAARAGQTKLTFRDVWVKYAAYGSSRTDGGRMRIKGWKTAASQSKKLLAFFGDLPWDQCNLTAVDGYRKMRSDDGVCAATRNREMQTAQASLSFGVRRGLIPYNPMARMTPEPVVNDRDFALSDEEVAVILKRCPGQLRQFLFVLSSTGMRRGELLTMEWTEVDLDVGFMKVLAHKAKSGKERDVPLSDEVRAVLEMIPQDGTNPYVWASSGDPKGHVPAKTLEGWWRKAREAAGITGPKGQKVWLHTMRHTFATNFVASGGSVEVAMAMCGWSGQTMARRYMNIRQRHMDTAKSAISAQTVHAARAVLGTAKRPKRAPAPAMPPQLTVEEEDEALALADAAE